jgi:hypothetical protein
VLLGRGRLERADVASVPPHERAPVVSPPHHRPCTRGVAVAPADRSRARASTASQASPAPASVSTPSPYSSGAGGRDGLACGGRGRGSHRQELSPRANCRPSLASRERCCFGSCYARTGKCLWKRREGMERAWPLCV